MKGKKKPAWVALQPAAPRGDRPREEPGVASATKPEHSSNNGAADVPKSDGGADAGSPVAPGEPLPPESFDDAGYLRLNPDVRRAVEMGQIDSGYSHYLLYGHAEGRPLPGVPREPHNVMLPAAAGAVPDAGATEVRCAIDALIVAPNCGLMIVGWIDDQLNALSSIRIVGSDWRVLLDQNRWIRLRRMDVEDALNIRAAHPFGFFAFLSFDRGGAPAGPLTVELWRAGGFWTALQCTPRILEDVDLRNSALAQLARSSFFGNASVESMAWLGKGFGEELLKLNRVITKRIVANPYMERFAPSRGPCRGTIVICLYGRPEYFFLQNRLFAGLPGIEDYEFIYVSNSPEMAEALLREARMARLIYGLDTSVVILPGNAGFGAANNAAARLARSDRLLIVNPDVFPRDPDWAARHTRLLEAAPEEQTRMFSVALFYDDGSLMHGGMYFEIDHGLSLTGGVPSAHRICRTEHYGKGAPAESFQSQWPRPVPAVTGAFISIARSWFEALGGFNEDFIFGHYEDADLALKSLEKGIPAWLHDIRLWHLESKGSSRQPPHEGGSIVNRWLFSRTWLSLIEGSVLGPTPAHGSLQSPATAPMARSTPEMSSGNGKRRVGAQRQRSAS